MPHFYVNSTKHENYIKIQFYKHFITEISTEQIQIFIKISMTLFLSTIGIEIYQLFF